jgi:hypothetical protein
MNTITSNELYEEYAKSFLWSDIFESANFSSRKVDTLKSDGTPIIEWTYDDGELFLAIQTFGEDEPALICDFDHKGTMMLTKFQALKKFRGQNNWTYTKQFIVEGISNGENTVDKISRKIWGNYLQSSSEMAPEVRYYSDPLFQAVVDAELGSLSSRELAKIKYNEMEFALEGEPTPAISLTELLSQNIQKTKWAIEGLLIMCGKVFLAAKAKSGKTTMSMSLLKSLADGEDFLGKFKVNPVEGRIGYMNLELTEHQMQEWVGRQDIKDRDRIHFWNLRGKVNPFRSANARNHLIEEIKSLGIKTLIIDTFSKIFPGEANNNSEVNRFLAMLDVTLDKAGVEQLIMLVHAGNDGSKIRGATALTDHPDGIWYLATDEEGNRFFHAIGRDISVPEGQLIYEPETSELTYTGASKKLTKGLSAKDKALAFIKENKGASAALIDDSIGGTKEFKIKIRKQLIKDGLVEVKKGPRNSDLYFPL